MDEFGQRLRNAREAQGIGLREIAATTKISVAALEALERNDFSRLPGGIFGRAFIRAYAEQVGLDPEDAVRQFLAEVARLEREAARNAPKAQISPDDIAFLEQQRRAARILRAAVIVVIVVVVVVFLIWKLRPTDAAQQAQTGAAQGGVATAGGQSPPPGDASASAPTGRDVTAAPGEPGRSTVQPPKPPTGGETGTTPAATAAAAPKPAGDAPAVIAAPLTVEFSVTAACWVQASADGRVVLQRLLQAGERERVTADQELVLDVGNAGAFAWSINGHPARPLGPEGVHKRARVTPANAGGFLQSSAPAAASRPSPSGRPPVVQLSNL